MASHKTVVKKVKGGWAARCSCGWEANNPLEERTHADDAVGYHVERAAADDAEAARIADELRAGA